MNTRSLLALLLLALVGWGGVASAQSTTIFPDPACNNWMVNPLGAAHAPLVINNTFNGIPIIAAAPINSVCGAKVTNTGTNPMTCGPTPLPVTAVNGDIINPGSFVLYGQEIWQGMSCFSTVGTTAYVQEIGKGPVR